MEEHGGEWGDPLAIGSVCDVVLAELVIDTSKIQDTPNSVSYGASTGAFIRFSRRPRGHPHIEGR